MATTLIGVLFSQAPSIYEMSHLVDMIRDNQFAVSKYCKLHSKIYVTLQTVNLISIFNVMQSTGLQIEINKTPMDILHLLVERGFYFSLLIFH